MSWGNIFLFKVKKIPSTMVPAVRDKGTNIFMLHGITVPCYRENSPTIHENTNLTLSTGKWLFQLLMFPVHRET